MREATEIEKRILEISQVEQSLRLSFYPQGRQISTSNSYIRRAQDRLLEARMWLEEAEKISDG